MQAVVAGEQPGVVCADVQRCGLQLRGRGVGAGVLLRPRPAHRGHQVTREDDITIKLSGNFCVDIYSTFTHTLVQIFSISTISTHYKYLK